MGRRPALLGLVLLGGAAFLAARAARATSERPRAIELVETVRVRPPKGAKAVRLWIPKPPSEGPQTAELLSVEAPASHRITSEAEFGNELVYLRASPKGGEPLDVTLRYRIVRRPQEGRARAAPEPASLAPRGLLAINDEIREIARRQTHGLSTPEEKGRALYDFVLKRMEYDKSGTGWGRGDSIYACRVGKGNCTDFHSLFMALAIASGLPARFRMGFSLPPPSEGDVDGYHCWAEFHAEGSGWIPVDISAAWKNPGREDFYFGRLDGSRVLVSTGREIRLSPPQSGGRLNFLSRPYAEADGEPIHDIEFTRSYKDEKAPRASHPQPGFCVSRRPVGILCLGVSVVTAWPGIKTFWGSILPSRVLSRDLLNTLLGRISFYRDREPAWGGRSHRQRRNQFSPFLMRCI